MWPQITYIVLTALSLGVTLAQHGKPRSPHNFWMVLISCGLGFWLLWAGGFFAVLS